MDIEFIGPASLAVDGGVFFPAVVDRNLINCHFTSEVLEDINPNDLHADPLATFEEHRLILLSIAESKIKKKLIHAGFVSVFSGDLGRIS
jgi:hypothetical protein